eukprot:45556_1
MTSNEQWTRQSLLKLEKAKLIKLCKSKNVNTIGKKSDMIDRLLKNKKPEKTLKKSNNKITKVTKNDLFASLLITLGPFLCGYISLIDLHKITASGILGKTKEWKSYIKTTEFHEKYMNKEFIKYRYQLLLRNHKISHFSPNRNDLIGKFELMDIIMNDHPNSDHDKGSKYWIDYLNNNQLDKISKIKLKNYNKIKQLVTKKIKSMLTRNSIEPLLIYLFYNNIYLEYSLMNSINIKHDENNHYIDNQQLIQFWTNFHSLFKIDKKICPSLLEFEYTYITQEYYSPEECDQCDDSPYEGGTETESHNVSIHWEISKYQSFIDLKHAINNYYRKLINLGRRSLDEITEEDVDRVNIFCKRDTIKSIESSGWRGGGLQAMSMGDYYTETLYTLYLNYLHDLDSTLFIPNMVNVKNWYLMNQKETKRM